MSDLMTGLGVICAIIAAIWAAWSRGKSTGKAEVKAEVKLQDLQQSEVIHEKAAAAREAFRDVPASDVDAQLRKRGAIRRD